jgi:cathepsin L
MTNAFYWAKQNSGVDTESSYPYEAKDDQKCRFNPSNVGGVIMDHMEIQVGNEEALKQAVATIGPVAAGVDAKPRSFQFYKSGYFYEPTCGTTEDDVSHAIVVVGYGKTDNGEEYW